MNSILMIYKLNKAMNTKILIMNKNIMKMILKKVIDKTITKNKYSAVKITSQEMKRTVVLMIRK